jgi:hypothetical protein
MNLRFISAVPVVPRDGFVRTVSAIPERGVIHAQRPVGEAALALVAPRRHPRDGVRLQRADDGHRPHLHERAADPRAGDRFHRKDAVHPRERRARAGGLPQVRPHGARHALGPRGVPRPRLQRRVPAPPLRDHSGQPGPGAARPRLRGARAGRGRGARRGRPPPAQGEPLRPVVGLPALLACRGRRVEDAGSGVGRVLLGRDACTGTAREVHPTRTSPGPRGPRSPTARARTTPTRTTGRTSRRSGTGRAPRPTCGARSAS